MTNGQRRVGITIKLDTFKGLNVQTLLSSRHSQLGNATLWALMWLLAGIVLTLLLVVDPLGVSPVDGWLGIERAAVGPGAEHGEELWTCGMHPEVLQEEPGICPICKMDLVPVKGEGGEGGPHGAAAGLWTCPMHPNIIEESPGQCPICGMDLVEVQAEAGTGGGEADAAQLWTCPMHPNIIEESPGQCPICGMDLVPVESEPQTQEAPAARDGRVVTINPVVVQNMNVRIQDVERRDLSRSVRTVGHLDYDQEAMVTVTTRYSGFVERVFAEAVGQQVRRGEPLFEVYAPELVQTQKELLSALRYARGLDGASDEVRRRAEQLVEAARTRLAYWEVAPEQIAAVESSGEVMRTLTVASPIDGVIMKRLHGLEGMAITPGMDVIHVADISTLWLQVEVYEDQLPWLAPGSLATVRFDYFPGEAFTGRVSFVEPEVSATTRTLQLTLEVPNRDRRLRVGMYATVVFEPLVARDAVVVPAQAVIRTGERDIVVLALGDGRFVPRAVTVGVQSEGLLQIIDGLDGSERVVTSAQFLIDSESNLRAAIDMLMAEKRRGGGS